MKKRLSLISVILISVSAFAYHPSTDSIISKLDSLGCFTPVAFKQKMDSIITREITAGEWYNKDFFYFWASPSDTSAKVDWRHPFTRMATVENYYVGCFTPYVGYKGNGSNFRINLNVNFGDGGTHNFTQNDNSFGYYVPTHVNESKVDMSCLNSSSVGIELNSLATSFSIQGKNNSGTSRSVANYTNVGCVASVRTASASWTITKNGYVLASVITDASSAPVNQNIYEFCRIVNGAKSQFSSKTHCYSWGGASCDVFKFNSIIEEEALIPLGLAPTTRYIISGNSFTSNGTWIKRFMVNNGYQYDVLVRGISGNTTPQLLADAPNTIFNKQKPYLTREVYVLQEFTNDFVAVSSSATTAYANAMTYLDSANNYFPSAEFVLVTMLPRNQASIVNANRQNPSNNYDDATLNGYIRNHSVNDGWTRFADPAIDTTIGDTGDELDTNEYLTDKIHLVTTASHGYNRFADLLTPSIQ